MSIVLADVMTNPYTQWVVLGIGMFGLGLVFYRNRCKRKKDPLYEAPPRFALAQERNVERQMQNLLVEMAEMARQISAQLDARGQKLELLIKEADEKMAELRTLTEATVEPPRVKTMRLVEDDPEPMLRRMTIPPSQPDPRYEQVYALADQGASAPEIAKRLNRPSGEVELILKLRGG
jgi:hypothetical protein